MFQKSQFAICSLCVNVTREWTWKLFNSYVLNKLDENKLRLRYLNEKIGVGSFPPTSMFFTHMHAFFTNIRTAELYRKTGGILYDLTFSIFHFSWNLTVYRDLYPLEGLNGRWNSYIFKCNVGCVFPMGVSILAPHAEFGWNDHREGAPHFILHCESYPC